MWAVRAAAAAVVAPVDGPARAADQPVLAPVDNPALAAVASSDHAAVSPAAPALAAGAAAVAVAAPAAVAVAAPAAVAVAAPAAVAVAASAAVVVAASAAVAASAVVAAPAAVASLTAQTAWATKRLASGSRATAMSNLSLARVWGSAGDPRCLAASTGEDESGEDGDGAPDGFRGPVAQNAGTGLRSSGRGASSKKLK